MATRGRGKAAAAELIDALGEVGLFSGLPRKKLQIVADMCREHTFAPGDEMVTQGDRSGRFYLLADGCAEVRVNGRTVAALSSGQHFGEYAVIDQEPRSASVVATTPVRAYSLASITLRPLLKEEPEITYRLLLNACQHLRAAQSALH
jgi:CRP-like cAMP-binding protein